jgi:hypothetical protein
MKQKGMRRPSSRSIISHVDSDSGRSTDNDSNFAKPVRSESGSDSEPSSMREKLRKFGLWKYNKIFRFFNITAHSKCKSLQSCDPIMHSDSFKGRSHSQNAEIVHHILRCWDCGSCSQMLRFRSYSQRLRLSIIFSNAETVDHIV